MFQNYMKIAWRNIMRYKVYTVINILGLSLGLCACIVIYVIVSYELSFDSFHPGKENIYRVMVDLTEGTGDKLHFARGPMPVSKMARKEVSGLDAVAGIIPYNAKIDVPVNGSNSRHFDSKIEGTQYITTAIAEPEYFNVFKYEWLEGNAATALNAPYALVLTENKAHQYFGTLPLSEIIGKEVVYDDSLKVRVTGIVKDWNKNTDLSFTDFISFSTVKSSFLKNNLTPDSWGPHDFSTWAFVRLLSSTEPAKVNPQLAGMFKRYGDSKDKLVFWLQPLSDIHFDADVIENPIRTAHKPTLYGLIAVALFILILAIINFINLSTAQSIQRAKEVGVRKVLGSSKTGLIFQFLTETLLLTLFAVVIAVTLVNPVLAAFKTFIPPGVTFHFLSSSVFVFLAIVTVVTALLSGLYPAKILSSYLPVLVLKGNGEQKGGERWLLRKGLIVFQFTVSLVFIIGSIVIASQLSYTRKKELGFNADAIVTIESPWGDSLSKIPVLAEYFKHVPGVSKVALQWVPPMTGNGRGRAIKFKSTDEKETGVTQVAGNEDFIPLYQMKLLAGRNLEHADSLKEFVINETLCRMMGCKKPEDAIGRMLYWSDVPYPVVGVVADFHSRSFHEAISPVCIVHRPEREGTFAVKLATKGKQSAAIQQTLYQLREQWRKIYPGATFNYKFYDESMALMYEKDQQAATLTNVSMAITIFISCIGLFGLALFTTQRRAKEISIRKIFGASVANITVMLSKDFIVLVVMAIIIASPIAGYLMNHWLQSFAYRIHLSWQLFLLAGVAAILIALITVSYQSVKAAITNPVKNLRQE